MSDGTTLRRDPYRTCTWCRNRAHWTRMHCDSPTCTWCRACFNQRLGIKR